MKKILMVIFCVCLFLMTTSFMGITSASDQTLAERYAPILYFEKNEKCFPVTVSYALDNSDLFQVGNPDLLLQAPLNASLLAAYTDDVYYLDNQKGTVADADDRIQDDYYNNREQLGYTVYVHLDTTNNVIQYWFFYAFNAGDFNRHEGDWEMIQIALSNGQPTTVAFSQHYAGQKATWGQVDKEGDNVKVYVARGSHANYIRPYSGKIGLASDMVSNNGKILRPQIDYDLELLDEASHPWLDFPGRWGWYGETEAQAAEAEALGQAGPHGPKFRQGSSMWYQPLVWANTLSPTTDLIFIMEWLVYHFVMLFLLILLVSLLLVFLFVYRRHKKHGLGPRKLSLFYIDGVNAKSIGNILCIVAIILAVLGVFYPWYTVTADISALSDRQTGSFDAITIDGVHGIQIRLPEKNGPIPLGTFTMPFYIIIGVGLLFLVLKTIGVSQSNKLGKKYLSRGIRLFVPFLLILILIMSLGMILPHVAPAVIKDNADVFTAANAISSSPFGGQYSMQIAETNGGYVRLHWGFGIGIYLLVFAGVFLLMAGLLLITAHVPFFTEKEPLPSTAEKNKKRKDESDEGKDIT